MIYKSKESKRYNLNQNKMIFNIIFLLYIAGLCAGCSFACKNAANFDFVKQVTFTEKMISISENSILPANTSLLLRDLIIFATVLIFKYAGLLKGLALCAPFISAIQNGSIYYVLLCQHKTTIYQLLFYYVLKDVAISLMLVLFVYITVKDIFNNREDATKDFKRLFVYYICILVIYATDYLIKSIIYPR